MDAAITLVNLNMLYIRYADSHDKELHLPLGLLYLTRVIEDDMGVDEARAVLRYLEKELDGFAPRTRPAKTPRRKVRRRTTAARKSRRMGKR